MSGLFDAFKLLLYFLPLFLFITMFVLIGRKIRKKGGSMATTILGATYSFYNSDKKKAIVETVERNAKKR